MIITEGKIITPPAGWWFWVLTHLEVFLPVSEDRVCVSAALPCAETPLTPFADCKSFPSSCRGEKLK